MIFRVVTKTWCPLAFHRKFSWESSSLSLDYQCLMPKKATYFPFQRERILELFIKSYVFDTYPSIIVWYVHLSLLFLCSIVRLTIIHLFGNKKRTGAERCLAVVSGIITGGVPVSYWPVTVPSDHPRSLCSMQRKSCLMAQG